MKTITCTGLTIAALFMASKAQAGVVIEGTRVVYPSAKSEVTVRMTNQRAYPVLVEAWIDHGDATQSETSASPPPFVLAPPLFRMEPSKAQTLRVFQLPQAANLPKDRESVFWLNVKDIPPEVKAEDGRLTIAYRSRLKFFYRPASLKAKQVDAFDTLTWSVDRGGESITVRNDSPYFITLSGVRSKDGTQSEGGMVAPFGSLQLPRPQNAVAGGSIEYTVINDYGASVIKEGKFDSVIEVRP